MGATRRSSVEPRSSLLRLLTTESVFAEYGTKPLTNRDAWEVYQALLGDERVSFRGDEPRALATLWRDYAGRPTSSPKLWMDAYLAAFSRTAGCTFVTFDSAFRQFRDCDFLLLGN